MKTTFQISFSLLATLAIATIANAQATNEIENKGGTTTVQNTPETSTPAEHTPREWEFEVAPYLWWSGVKSTIEYGDVETSSELSFLDAIEHLKFGGLIHAEATNNRWGFMTDIVYMKLGESTEKRIGDKLKSVNIDVKADLAQSMFELGAFYRFKKDRYAVDLLAGGRYFGFSTDLEVGPVKIDRDKDWVDPFVGSRLNVQLSPKWAFSVRGDVGGFGVGSDLTWNASALFRYRIRENMDLGFGYRYMDVYKSSDDGSYDAQTSGPLLGMSMRF